MKNKNGFVLSTYVYLLLVFFLLLLGTMLVVLNNTKLLSNKLKEGTQQSSGLIDKDFSFILLGDKNLKWPLGEEFKDPGFITKTVKGVDLSEYVKVDSNVNTEEKGNYEINYKITYNGKTKEENRNVIVKGKYKLNVNLDGGSDGGDYATEYFEGDKIKLVKPIKEGYNFVGWSIETGTNAVINDDLLIMGSSDTEVKAGWEEIVYVPTYACANGTSLGNEHILNYSGNCEFIDDGDNNWRIRFLTSGELTITKNMTIDAFLVGGGGAGAGQGGGGGGGYTNTQKSISLSSSEPYSIVIGEGGLGDTGGTTNPSIDGQSSTAFGYEAKGGYAATGSSGGNGGSGGGGGTGYPTNTSGSEAGWNGSDGGFGSTGQGTTTCEFGELDSNNECLYSSKNGYKDNGYDGYYSGGGAGYCGNAGGTDYCSLEGGKGDGGKNVWYGSGYTAPGYPGEANTGGGGGGSGLYLENEASGSGGSGIVIIRNAK